MVPENIYEIEKDDVDLSSFELKDELNEKFWKDGKLDTKVRRQLLIIARDFISQFDISDFGIEDVTMTGSLANYNWDEKYSDIDLHIIVDYKDVNDDVELVKEFFNAVKSRWNDSHKNISIYGFPVELYVQDASEPHKSTGVYSLLYDKWISKPSKEVISDKNVDEDKVKETVAWFVNKIDEIIELYENCGEDCDAHDLSVILDCANDLYKQIRETRSSGFTDFKSELSSGNLIFKSLRRNGSIGVLNDLRLEIYDRINSLNGNYED